jgi:hypothetical protein
MFLRLSRYRGAQIGQITLKQDPDRPKWFISSDKYIKEAIRNVQNWLTENSQKGLKSRAPLVFPSGYKAELDATEYCDETLSHYYQQQIGVLRWAVELGRINICTEVSILASYTAAPRIGYFNAMLHIFAFLHHHPRCKLVMDDDIQPQKPIPDEDWREFYPHAKANVPTNSPKARGKTVQITCVCDSDHAGNLLTRCSRTGVLIFVNRAPVQWYLKKQSGVGSSSFGSEFMALKVATDLVQGLRYKLRMMGVSIDGPTRMRIDNMSVVQNTTQPEEET